MFDPFAKTIEMLVEQCVRIGKERDDAIQSKDKLYGEVYQLRSRAFELERKYEPKPVRYWKQAEVDAEGNEVRDSVVLSSATADNGGAEP